MSETTTSVDSLIAQAVRHQQQGDVRAAIGLYNQALIKSPGHPDALHLCGVAMAQQGQTEDAISFINRAILQRPKFSEALFNLGQIYQAQNRLQDAVNAYVRAARFRKGYTAAWYRLGTLYLDVEMYDAAVIAFENALDEAPDNEDIHDALCLTYKRQGLYEECIRAADRGLASLPESAQLWIHRSEASFALGHLPDGWRNYAWRRRHPGNPNRPRDYGLPEWQGEDLHDKTIVILTEQGPGETFLLSSMIPEIVERVRRCLIVTSNRLAPILQRSFPDTVVVPEETADTLPEKADFQILLGDAGLYLRPSLASFPNQKPHIVANSELSESIRKRYNDLFGDSLIAGISWRTSDSSTAAAKSASLEELLPVLRTPGVSFVSVQYGDTSQERAAFNAKHGITIYSESELDPVADLESHLAQLTALDVIISTSNTAAHAAAAMGVPTWCLLPNRLGEGLRWYWFPDQSESPWYQNVRLFRQSQFGDWSVPIAEAAVKLAKRVASDLPISTIAGHLEAMAVTCQRRNQVEATGLFASAALSYTPSSPAAMRLSVQCNRLTGRLRKGLELLDEATSSETLDTDTGLLLERSICLIDDNRPEEALRVLLSANKLKPKTAEILYQLGLAYRLNGQTEEGVSSLRDALDVSPGHREIRRTLGTLLKDCGETDEAVALFDGLIAEDSTDVRAAHTRGLALLDGQRLEEGWPAFQNRLRERDANISYARFPHPIWNGEALGNAHVLVWTEQGIGEELLVASLIPALREHARRVTLLCTDRLEPLFRRSFPDVCVDVRTEPATENAVNPDIDFQMSLSDLGTALRPSIKSFEHTQRNKFLFADESLRQEFRSRYEQLSNGRRIVGVSWHSATPEIGPLKSIDAETFSELIVETDSLFVSLQYAPSDEDIEILARAGGQRWHVDDSVDALTSMDIAAAQTAAMDSVITVSNSTAHLAGALGLPTALLVPAKSGRHWYWFRGKKFSPWYPSIRLFEQQEQNKWPPPLREIIESFARDGANHG